MTQDSNNPVTETELHAWLDDEIPSERRDAVQRHLEANPEVMARLGRYREHAALIARTYGPLIDRSAPAPTSLASRANPSRPWRMAAAAAVVALASFAGGTGSGWILRGALDRPATPPFPSLVTDAMAAHRTYSTEVRHPVEVGADQREHLTAWLSKRLGAPLAAPNLATEGWDLVGGRLLPSDSGPAALFLYQDATGRRITLYVRPNGTSVDTAFRFAREDRISAFYWKDGTLSWALAGEADREALLSVAHAVYKALNS